MRTHLFAAPLVGIALVLAGCGSSDDKGLSKADYVKQADAICSKGDAASEAAGKAKLGDKPTQADVVSVISDILIPNIEGQLKALRALKAPDGDADTVKGIYDALDAGVAKAKADPAAAAASADGPFADATAKAKAYGLKSCGSSS